VMSSTSVEPPRTMVTPARSTTIAMEENPTGEHGS
jgi:hypothetical protein